jgi:hypothetical protein
MIAKLQKTLVLVMLHAKALVLLECLLKPVQISGEKLARNTLT